ncbi:hypothetical protein ACFV2N_33100 [Streptomyces sp. NPDC059680]|uniref:hypothetical protein n=1 Tax=Streptomyces sp. NPDC059680 TaxID=3346904 RepID=UPI00368DE044
MPRSPLQPCVRGRRGGLVWRHAAWWTAPWPAVTVVCGLLLWLLHRFGAGRVRWRTAVAAAVALVSGGRDPGVAGRPLPSYVLGGRLFGALPVALAVIVYEGPRPGHADTAEHRPG